MHVGYACRHTGACCGAGWPLPVEHGVAPALAAAVSDGCVRPADDTAEWMTPHAAAPDGVAGTLRLLPDGHCVFHQAAPGGGRQCAVHAALGHAHLPAACRHFPRVCLVDGRGVHVTLSHFCPTAAALLVAAEGAVSIVEGPAPVPGRDVPEGLDARDAWPPLLTPAVLMDLEGYDAWERHMVETIAGARMRGRSAAGAVARLAADARVLQAWRPGGQPLAEAVAMLADRGDDRDEDRLDARGLFDEARASCRAPWTWDAAPADLAALDARFVAPGWDGVDDVVRRYLAAHAFASWEAYQAGGGLAVVRAVARALAVVRIEAARAAGLAGTEIDRAMITATIRRADLLLRHYATFDGLA
ncbi:MAG: hypothetical protein Q8L86_09060 [Vicinamibacterales bacterium]|nr:hypothetical protein [Vicinamibacterales bacterium]